MEQLIELLQQIQDLAGAGIDALSQAMGEEGGGPPPGEGGPPPGEGGPPPEEGGGPPPEEGPPA